MPRTKPVERMREIRRNRRRELIRINRAAAPAPVAAPHEASPGTVKPEAKTS